LNETIVLVLIHWKRKILKKMLNTADGMGKVIDVELMEVLL